MLTESSSDITGLLQRAESGDSDARDALLPLIYDELKRAARRARGGQDAQTLNTTALVHEAYLRLVGNEQLSWPDRRRFFVYAAQTMRSILIDRAREHLALKRGGDVRHVEWEAVDDQLGDESHVELLELDAGLTRLARSDEGLARIVELHVFAGLEFADVAQCLGISERSAFRGWHKAKAALRGLMGVAMSGG